MKQEQLMDIFALVKRTGTLLAETEDITNQLAEAVDRQDEISIDLITSMRYDPIDKLTIADLAVREHLVSLETEDQNRIRALLNGDDTLAQNEMEKALAQQAASNMRLHQKLLEKDRNVNRKITRDKSIYQ